MTWRENGLLKKHERKIEFSPYLMRFGPMCKAAGHLFEKPRVLKRNVIGQIEN